MIANSRAGHTTRLAIRPADLRLDRDVVIRTLSRYLTPGPDAKRFGWLYLTNPAGPAKVWIAEGAGKSVGVGAAFPRRLVVNGVETPACVLGDFCIAPDQRSLGPAVQLQRACLEPVHSAWAAAAYDFPSQGMMAVYRRLGIAQSTELIRLAKPLRADRTVAERVSSKAVARGLSAVANLALRVRDLSGRADAGLSVETQAGPCGSEFTELAQRVCAGYGICLFRSAEYLNWRFRANPLEQCEILTARREGKLLAFAVIAQHKENASILDLFGEIDERIVGSLIQRITGQMRERGVMTLSAPMTPAHPFFPVLRGMGFHLRESSPVVVATDRKVLASARWSLMAGDRDL